MADCCQHLIGLFQRQLWMCAILSHALFRPRIRKRFCIDRMCGACNRTLVIPPKYRNSFCQLGHHLTASLIPKCKPMMIWDSTLATKNILWHHRFDSDAIQFAFKVATEWKSMAHFISLRHMCGNVVYLSFNDHGNRLLSVWYIRSYTNLTLDDAYLDRTRIGKKTLFPYVTCSNE